MKWDFQAPVHAVPEELRIYTGPGAQDDTFADRQTDATTHQVMRQFDHGSGSKLAGIDHRVAERIKNRFHFTKDLLRSGRQNLHASIGDAVLTDNKRRIHHPRAARVKLVFNASNKIRGAAGKIDVETALMDALQKPHGAKSDLLDFQRTWKGSEHYPAMPGNVRR